LIAVSEFVLAAGNLKGISIHYHFDALSVGMSAFGVYNGCQGVGATGARQKDARILMFLVQRANTNIAGFHTCSMTHAHVGHPWNGMVDSIAGAICEGWKPPVHARLRCQQFLKHPLKNCAWMQVQRDEEMPNLETVLQNAEPTQYKGEIDLTLQKQLCARGNKQWTKRLRLVTANVGTLEQSAGAIDGQVSRKTVELLQQFQQEGAHIIAIQEGRARKVRHVAHGPFDCLIGAGQQGQAGVELWLHTAELQKIFGSGVQVHKDVCVWAPRLLVASCHFAGVHVEIMVGYAP